MFRNICSSRAGLFETRCELDISAVRHGVRLAEEIAEYFPAVLLEAIVRKNRLLRKTRTLFRTVSTVIISLLLAAPAFAQANSPWENAVSVLQQAFTSTIARGLSLVAIVVSGLTFAFGEGGSKRVLAGVLFGVGMAIAAVNFLAWLFPG
jgi:type IV secretion system protein TrbC